MYKVDKEVIEVLLKSIRKITNDEQYGNFEQFLNNATKKELMDYKIYILNFSEYKLYNSKTNDLKSNIQEDLFYLFKDYNYIVPGGVYTFSFWPSRFLSFNSQLSSMDIKVPKALEPYEIDNIVFTPDSFKALNDEKKFAVCLGNLSIPDNDNKTVIKSHKDYKVYTYLSFIQVSELLKSLAYIQNSKSLKI